MAEDHEMVFNRHFMDIYLDQYQTYFDGVPPTYDDIVEISVNDVVISTLTDLPKTLENLTIMNSTLTHFEIPIECQSIRKLLIYKSNLTVLPRLSHVCDHFEYVNFSRAAISQFTDTDEAWIVAPYLREIILEQNYLTTVPSALLEFRGRLLLRNNPFLSEKIQLLSTNYRDMVKYRHYPVTIARVNKAQAQNTFAKMVKGTATNVMLDAGAQTVHISSINKSITKSINRIVQLSKAAPPLDESEIKKALESEWKSMSFIDSKDVHSISEMTYKELLIHVCRVANSLSTEKCIDVITRLKDEIVDGKGMCFTGQMNRLVNSLVGFDIHPDIMVSYSVKEQLQMEMSKLIEAYRDKTKTYLDVVREINIMFEELTPEVMMEETIPIEYKSTWLVALRDLHIDSLETELADCIKYGRDERKVQVVLWPLQIEAWTEEMHDAETSDNTRTRLEYQIKACDLKLTQLLKDIL